MMQGNYLLSIGCSEKPFRAARWSMVFAFAVQLLVSSASGNVGGLTDDPFLADLIYDSTTGNVKFDAVEAAGGIITNFVLQNDIDELDFDAPDIANFPFVGPFTTDSLTEISQTDGTGVGFSGMHDLADVFPIGLSLTDLDSFLTTRTYVGELGSGVMAFDLIPEPSSLTCFALAGVLLLHRRRRARATAGDFKGTGNET